MKRNVVFVLLVVFALAGCAPGGSPGGGDAGGDGGSGSSEEAPVVGAPVEPCTQELKDSFAAREGLEVTIEHLDQPVWPAEFPSFNGQTASCAYTYVGISEDTNFSPPLQFEQTRMVGVYVGLDEATVTALLEASVPTDADAAEGWYEYSHDYGAEDDQLIHVGWGNYIEDATPWNNVDLTSNLPVGDLGAAWGLDAEATVTTFWVETIDLQS